METVYKIENLTFTYPGCMGEQQALLASSPGCMGEQQALLASSPNSENPALDGINLSIERGAFIVLCGPSGCGKTTLLRQLKPSIAPHGIKQGAIHFEGAPLDELTPRDAAAKIGFVLQSPDNQIVTDKVWHELAFGLENLGLQQADIRLRVAEMASFFGIQTWFHKPVTELSGGQKQLLALASVMALQPTALILDEPTSQLDPVAAGEFLGTVAKINRELGVTVILTEHRLEEAFPLATRAVVMDKGRIIADGAPRDVGISLQECDSGMFLAMPTPMRVWMACEGTGVAPITARDGATWLQNQAIQNEIEKTPPLPDNKIAVEITETWFKYEKHLPDVVKGLNFKANYGELTTILGGNGTGKTTTLSLIAGLNTPYRGKIFADTQVYALPQNPQALFVAKTVREDLMEITKDADRLADIEKLCRLEGLLDRHPYDLSGGEQQRAALAKVLLLQPKILLLDEPTKGLDAEYKRIFAAILSKLTNAGAAVVMVSHDVEFCAEYADRCALFFDGSIVTENTPRKFFNGNNFYTTTANRMARNILPEAITAGDIIHALGGTPAPKVFDQDAQYKTDEPKKFKEIEKKSFRTFLPKTREVVFLAFAMLFLAAVTAGWVHWDGLSAFIGGGRAAITAAEDNALIYIAILIGAFVAIVGIAITLAWKRGEKTLQQESGFAAFFPQGCSEIAEQFPSIQKKPLSKRTMAAAALVLLFIPLTIFVGIHFLDDRQFYFISMLIILQTMLPFALVFEGRKPQAREVVVIAVLIAIAVAGRGAFFMLPQFKPILALIIIAGVSFGAESGFLVGAMSMFVSNMFFGQGPWTPWQMFAAGIIGFLAGVLFRKGLLSRSPIPLAIFGGISAFVIYGGIMSPASVLIWQPNPTSEMFLLAILHGIPFNLVLAIATVFFIILFARPMLEKLDRIKVKYGLVE